MFVCFHGEGISPCWKYIQNTSCKEHLVFSNCFLPGGTGVNTGHYRSTALILFYSFQFSVPSPYHHSLGSVFGKKWIEITFFWKDQLKISHIPLSLQCGWAFLIPLSLSGEHRQLAEKVPKLGAVISRHKQHSCGVCPSLCAVTLLRNREGQTKWANTVTSLLFSWGGGNIPSKYFIISNEKGWMNINILNINTLNTLERRIYIRLVISILTCSWWAASCSVMS